MKKIILSLSLITFFTISVNAQELGVRFGNDNGSNVAVDAVLQAGEFSRIHANLSFDNGLGLDLIWDFIYKPLSGEELYWYAGLGPNIFIGDPFALGAVGELGLEYRFKKAPIVIGADWRPFFRLIDNTDLELGGFGFNVRYRF